MAIAIPGTCQGHGELASDWVAGTSKCFGRAVVSLRLSRSYVRQVLRSAGRQRHPWPNHPVRPQLPYRAGDTGTYRYFDFGGEALAARLVEAVSTGLEDGEPATAQEHAARTPGSRAYRKPGLTLLYYQARRRLNPEEAVDRILPRRAASRMARNRYMIAL